jgi:hypothetical protein
MNSSRSDPAITAATTSASHSEQSSCGAATGASWARGRPADDGLIRASEKAIGPSVSPDHFVSTRARDRGPRRLRLITRVPSALRRRSLKNFGTKESGGGDQTWNAWPRRPENRGGASLLGCASCGHWKGCEHSPHPPDRRGRLIAVQCKGYGAGSRVGVQDLRQFVGALPDVQAHGAPAGGLFVTTSGYTCRGYRKGPRAL